MAYADYYYYMMTYFGTAIPQDAFDRLAARASAYIDYYTQGRAAAAADTPAVKMACCALAEQYLAIDSAQAALASAVSKPDSSNAEVQSETVGSWSRTYKTSSESAASLVAAGKEARAQLAEIARQYLAQTGMLYRGGRCYR